ncbi:hypothetical protein DFJ74DRAFT_115843 [Hyaloraphidium curvatum]|nr:hypothetical protein DFJ74DRAFT_115843 [Hyaloraphidium curvatum]
MMDVLPHPRTGNDLRVDAHFIDGDGDRVMLEFDGAYFHAERTQKDADKTAVMASIGRVVRIRDLGLEAVDVEEQHAANVKQAFLTRPFRGFANLRLDVLHVLATDLELGPGWVSDEISQALGRIADRVVIRLAGIPEADETRDGDIQTYMSY